ncbi:hypothetical protein BN946_scf184985.g134 [Trametes cinnabarina]|uniref:Uncharacterized protein n=1 Tax=Pycnoporus cinnabarinus TaxID=5643 RepID=A0A060SKF2_PYCCI|nr:hypothetical protein BN946_scf184985.g134 [Trametes cinnabarina]
MAKNSKKKLELPSGLSTRAANRGRLVGAPDMPRPRRSPEEVTQERETKAREEEETRSKQALAIAWVAAIEEKAGEDNPPTKLKFKLNLSQFSRTTNTVAQTKEPTSRCGADAAHAHVSREAIPEELEGEASLMLGIADNAADAFSDSDDEYRPLAGDEEGESEVESELGDEGMNTGSNDAMDNTTRNFRKQARKSYKSGTKEKSSSARRGHADVEVAKRKAAADASVEGVGKRKSEHTALRLLSPADVDTIDDSDLAGLTQRAKTSSSLTKVIPRTSMISLLKKTNLAGPSTASQSEPKPVPSKIAIASLRSTATPGKRGKSKMADLSNALRPIFIDRFVPLVRQYLGTITPWQKLDIDETQKLYKKAFGAEIVSQYGLLEEGDHCWRLIRYRIDDWHTKFVSTALTSFQEVLEDPDHAELFSSAEIVAQYAIYLLGDAGKNAPFYWKEWNNGKKKLGCLQHDLIVRTFAYHVAELQAVGTTKRVMDYPVGALTLSVLAVRHVLTHYSTGVWSPPDGRPGWFSEDNYGDISQFKHGVTTNVHDKRLTRVLKVAKDLNDQEWADMYEAAWVVVQERKQKARRGKSGHARSSSEAPQVLPEDSDEDLMLVADE